MGEIFRRTRFIGRKPATELERSGSEVALRDEQCED